MVGPRPRGDDRAAEERDEYVHRRVRASDDRGRPAARGGGAHRRPRRGGVRMSHRAAPPIQTTPAQRGIRLKVADLEVRLGRSGPDVVSEISFAVQAGEALGLAAESASAKTPVARAPLSPPPPGLPIP